MGPDQKPIQLGGGEFSLFIFYQFKASSSPMTFHFDCLLKLAKFPIEKALWWGGGHECQIIFDKQTGVKTAFLANKELAVYTQAYQHYRTLELENLSKCKSYLK